MSLLNFLAASPAFSTMGVLFAAIASVCLLVALMPPFIQVYKTNQTFALAEKFLLFAAISALFFGTMGFVEFIAWENSSGIAFGIVTFFTNLCSLCVNSFILKRKKQNLDAAKKLGLSEMDYYYQYTVPNLQASSDVVDVISEEKTLVEESKNENVEIKVESLTTTEDVSEEKKSKTAKKK